MRIIAKTGSEGVLLEATFNELKRITGNTTYESDTALQNRFCVNTTIAVVDTYDALCYVVTAPERLKKLSASLRDEADKIDKLQERYARVITPPVKPLKV
jgi:hypothetical protein